MLQAVAESPVTRLVGQAALDTLAALREIVSTMARGEPPGTRWMTSAFFQKARPRLDLFMSHPKPKPDSSGATVYWYGRPAAQKKFTSVMAQDKVTFEDLTPLHVFRHLLDEGQVAQVEEKTRQLLAGVTTGAAASSSGQSAPKARTSNRKTAGKGDTQEAAPIADVMVLFS